MRGSRGSRTNLAILTSESAEHIFWVNRAQQCCDLEQDHLHLNLQPNQNGIPKCRGRIQGEYPIYLPDTHLYTQKLVQQEHLWTLHGGVVGARLRRLAKRSIRACHGCWRFQAQAAATPPPGNLPVDRSRGTHTFQVIGVDYAGPLKYKKRGKAEGKVYIAL